MIKINSSAFKEGEMIPSQYTADGKNVSPPLSFDGVPANAVSLALVMDDPDAPMGTWNHWLIWNMDPKTREILEDAVPAKAILGANDFGKTPYGGPAPPSGTHRYYFRVFALDAILSLPQGAKRAALDKAMAGHILAQGSLMGKYQRKK